MDIATPAEPLDQPPIQAEFLADCGLDDLQRAREAVSDLVGAGVPLELVGGLCRQLGTRLTKQADRDAALALLCRFVLATRSPFGMAALLERDTPFFDRLLAALLLGPQWAELLVEDP